MRGLTKFVLLGLLSLNVLEYAKAVPLLARSKALRRSSLASNIVELPRGGGNILGTPVKSEHLIALYYSFYGLNGALGMPAPESSAGTFSELTQTGSPSYVAYEHLGAISLGYASLVYLSASGKGSVPSAVALSTLPLAYVRYKNLLQGSASNFGEPMSLSILIGAILIVSPYLILNLKGHVTLIAQGLALLPLLSGALAEINPDLGAKIWGFPALKGQGKAFFIWFAALLAGYGVLAAMLLQGMDPIQAIGFAALLETFFMIDCIYLRKWNVGVAPPESNYVFLGIPLITGLAILLS